METNFSFFKRRKIKIAIVTSKNLKRTKLILKRFNIKVNLIQCPSVNIEREAIPRSITQSN